MKKKLSIFLVISILILAACGGSDVSVDQQSGPDFVEASNPTKDPDSEDASNSFEEVEPNVKLPEDFPVITGAVLASYFDFMGMYQYTYAFEGTAEEMRGRLIPQLFDIGIIASGFSFSQYASGDAQDIVLSDNGQVGFLGYIVLHPEEHSDFNDIPGYTVTVGDSIFDYEPFMYPPLSEDIEEPEEVSIYPGAVLFEYDDRRELFQNNELFKYVYHVEYFSGEEEQGQRIKEFKEIYDFYINDLTERNFDIEEDNRIFASKNDLEVTISVRPFYIAGSVHGAEIEIIK